MGHTPFGCLGRKYCIENMNWSISHQTRIELLTRPSKPMGSAHLVWLFGKNTSIDNMTLNKTWMINSFINSADGAHSFWLFGKKIMYWKHELIVSHQTRIELSTCPSKPMGSAHLLWLFGKNTSIDNMMLNKTWMINSFINSGDGAHSFWLFGKKILYWKHELMISHQTRIELLTRPSKPMGSAHLLWLFGKNTSIDNMTLNKTWMINSFINSADGAHSFWLFGKKIMYWKHELIVSHQTRIELSTCPSKPMGSAHLLWLFGKNTSIDNMMLNKTWMINSFINSGDGAHSFWLFGKKILYWKHELMISHQTRIELLTRPSKPMGSAHLVWLFGKNTSIDNMTLNKTWMINSFKNSADGAHSFWLFGKKIMYWKHELIISHQTRIELSTCPSKPMGSAHLLWLFGKNTSIDNMMLNKTWMIKIFHKFSRWGTLGCLRKK